MVSGMVKEQVSTALYTLSEVSEIILPTHFFSNLFLTNLRNDMTAHNERARLGATNFSYFYVLTHA